MRTVFLSSISLLVALTISGCYGESSQKVTDDPKYVGSYRRGQIYTFKVDVQGIAKAGEKLTIEDAYLLSGINYARVQIYGRVISSSSTGQISILRLSVQVGDQNLGGAYVSGPDPNLLELSK